MTPVETHRANLKISPFRERRRADQVDLMDMLSEDFMVRTIGFDLAGQVVLSGAKPVLVTSMSPTGKQYQEIVYGDSASLTFAADFMVDVCPRGSIVGIGRGFPPTKKEWEAACDVAAQLERMFR